MLKIGVMPVRKEAGVTGLAGKRPMNPMGAGRASSMLRTSEWNWR